MINSDAAKRAYDAVALFALLNLMFLGGAALYLIVTGVIDGEKAARIGAVMRGEWPAKAVASEPAPAQVEKIEVVSRPAEDAIAESEMALEIMRREAERIKEELRQQLALANSIMIRVTAERESYERRREEDLRQQQAAIEQRNAEGFKKVTELLKGLKPKLAVEILLGMQDAEDAANILLEMDTRSAKKIVGAAKSAEQVTQMRDILRRMRNASPERAADLEN